MVKRWLLIFGKRGIWSNNLEHSIWKCISMVKQGEIISKSKEITYNSSRNLKWKYGSEALGNSEKSVSNFMLIFPSEKKRWKGYLKKLMWIPLNFFWWMHIKILCWSIYFYHKTISNLEKSSRFYMMNPFS